MNSDRDKGASAPFSAYARGVQLAGRASFDFGLLLESGGRQLVDISGAIVNFVLAQGWHSIFNLVITIAANSFYTFLGFAAVAAYLDFTLVSFVVLLPLVLAAFHALQRRNQALNDLSQGTVLADLGAVVLELALLRQQVCDDQSAKAITVPARQISQPASFLCVRELRVPQ